MTTMSFNARLLNLKAMITELISHLACQITSSIAEHWRSTSKIRIGTRPSFTITKSLPNLCSPQEGNRLCSVTTTSLRSETLRRISQAVFKKFLRESFPMKKTLRAMTILQSWRHIRNSCWTTICLFLTLTRWTSKKNWCWF